MNKNQASVNTNSSLLPPLEKQSFFSQIRHYIKHNPYSYLFYSFLIPVALMYLIYLAMGIYPFGDGSVLVLDLNGQYVSFYEMLHGALRGDTSLIYSFERALGGEFMGIYAYYLASPFSYIVALFPKKYILDALLAIFLLKSGLCGLTMGWYLHRNTKDTSRNKISIILFSVLYAMSAYCVVQQHNSMWIDAVIWLPVLTYAIEQLIKNGKFKLFVLILALTLCSNYYIGYMVCIYVAAYFFYYYFAYNQKTDGAPALNNPHGERNHFTKSFFRIVLYSALAIGIAAIIVFTAYYSLKFGKSSFSDPSWTVTAKFEFMEFLTKFLPGSYDTVRPEGLPFVYCGLLTVLLIPVYFLSKKFTQREKIASGLVILFFVLSFVISVLDLIWHGFQRPNWLNYRYSFMLCFFLVVLAYKAFGEIRKISFKTLLAIFSAFAGFVIVAQTMTFDSYTERVNGAASFGQKLLTFETVFLSLLCILAYLIILAVTRKTKQRASISLILAIVCCLEVYCSGLVCDREFGKDVIYTSRSKYTDYMDELRPVVDAVKKTDLSFYRMEKTTMRKTNDSMALDMNSLCCSTSTLNRETIDFLRYMGYASKSNWSKYLGGTPVNDSLLGIKYLLSDSDVSDLYEIHPIDLEEENDYTAYLNPYALSLAFGVNSTVNGIDVSNSENYYKYYGSPIGFMNNLVSAMLGEDSLLQLYRPIEASPSSTTNCTTSAVSDYIKYAPLNIEEDCSITYTIDVPRDQGDEVELYFFIPADQYTREVDINVSANSLDKTVKHEFGGNETNRIVTLGTFRAGESVSVKVTIDNGSNNLYIKKGEQIFYYVDKAVFKDAFTRLLANPQYVVDDNCPNDHLTGKITTTASTQTILTTIPYDEGWTVLVDGQRVSYEKSLNALISFEIEGAGEHKLEFVYRPSALVLGITVSVASIAIFVLVCIFEKKIRAFLWKGKGKTIGVSDDAEVAVIDASLWEFSFYTYDPTDEESDPPSASLENTVVTESVSTEAEDLTEESAPATEEHTSEDQAEACDPEPDNGSPE
ncbi:MAG: YfhO family protein [Clostridia bacterium]|nr:YfhO family protein [Clostridia bacterium]